MKTTLIDIPTSEFDYNYLIAQLADHRFPRNRIGYLIKMGDIIRVKKGLYVKREGYSLPVLANQIYGPSYVSQQYALAIYGLIAERVTVVTSVALGRKKKEFDTPVGKFVYEPLSEVLFPFGIRRAETSPAQGYLIATPEKAVVDLVWKSRKLSTPREMEDFLVHDQRIDVADMRKFSAARARALARVYDRPAVHAFARLLSERGKA